MRIHGALTMRIAAAIMWAAVSACAHDAGMTAPTPAPPPVPTVLLKDVEFPGLPSPYFHFEYSADGRITRASYASDLRTYDVQYEGQRISVQEGRLGNRDRLEYAYDDSGRVEAVRYRDATGQVYARVILAYHGPQLVELRRDRTVDGGFIIDKTMTFSYYADGNVREVVEHHPGIAGLQEESTTIDRYEQYDDKLNVDGFTLLHTEFFDHLLLVPALQLQRNNPGLVTRTGDGANYTVVYAYSLDASGRPQTKRGDVTFLTGADAGSHAQTLSAFTYY